MEKFPSLQPSNSLATNSMEKVVDTYRKAVETSDKYPTGTRYTIAAGTIAALTFLGYTIGKIAKSALNISNR